MLALFTASSGFTMQPRAAGVVVAPAVSPVYAAPVMMAKKDEEPWSIDKILRGPKEKFVGAGGIELLSGVSRPITGKTVKVDGSSYVSEHAL